MSRLGCVFVYVCVCVTVSLCHCIGYTCWVEAAITTCYTSRVDQIQTNAARSD